MNRALSEINPTIEQVLNVLDSDRTDHYRDAIKEGIDPSVEVLYLDEARTAPGPGEVRASEILIVAVTWQRHNGFTDTVETRELSIIQITAAGLYGGEGSGWVDVYLYQGRMTDADIRALLPYFASGTLPGYAKGFEL